MNIMKILEYKINNTPNSTKDILPINISDTSLQSAHRKINLICNNTKERKECYHDIKAIFLD